MICKDLQSYARFCKDLQYSARVSQDCKILQESARFCKDLQDFTRIWKILQGSSRFCKDLQDSLRICKILQRYARICKIMQSLQDGILSIIILFIKTLQFSARICNTQEESTNCKIQQESAIFLKIFDCTGIESSRCIYFDIFRNHSFRCNSATNDMSRRKSLSALTHIL